MKTKSGERFLKAKRLQAIENTALRPKKAQRRDWKELARKK
jgi:hypothetical protein